MSRCLLSIPLVLLLAACGGSPSAPTPPPDLFTEANAWKDPLPPGAEQVGADEFARGIASGEDTLTSTAAVAARKAAREQQYRTDRAELEAVTNPSPGLRALLSDTSSITQYEGERPVRVPDGQTIVLFGAGTEVRDAVETERRSRDVGNALADYRLSYTLLPDALRPQAPTPESLQGQSLEAVRAALAQLDTLLGSAPVSLGPARLEARAVAPQAIAPGNGTDNNGTCTPTNLVARYWFPLKNFVSPVKNQAGRGTCWAFTAIGALESRERVQNDNRVDLSEQFLVNKVKQDWDASDYTDGYWSERALDTAAARGQVFPSESGWTYNPASSRPNVPDGDAAAYANTCSGYTGTCSDTAHQSRQRCTTVLIATFCSFVRVTYTGAGVTSSTTLQVWKNGDRFDLNRLRRYLWQGYVLLASFPVYKGFMDDVGANGVVSNYARTRLDAAGKEVDGSYGGHAVQIVGFLSNQDLTSVGVTPNVGGGGYFIVKNSWGCANGDGGFYYVPADYVSGLFNSLSVLNFDARRSDAWTREQATPGGSDPPVVQIRTGTVTADLRVEKDLTSAFLVSHPVARSVNLRVTSDRDGVLLDGPWSTDRTALFGSTLKSTFGSVGARVLTLVARYGSREATASFTVNVVNTPPAISLPVTGSPAQGVAFPLTAVITDPNESDAAGLCARTTWSVDAPDVVSPATGCQVSVTFGTTGNRAVRISTSDGEGAPANQTFTLSVQPPPVDPYPVISGGGVSSRQFVPLGNGFICGAAPVGTGATIDLREKGCTLTGAQPQRYFAQVTVQNPSGEALRYDWTLFVTEDAGERVLYGNAGSTSATFDLFPWGNSLSTTGPCRVAVTVHAPDASRDKSQTVWTGRCTYYVARIN
ncbi:C1 family peptidase [Deinococcus pimensis]|uniref:C1 family peptidase n=1 Tax=Deinococcus pimensis TaxID=309888 RepID=UPI0004B1E3C3|nr:C1 family peptidase [Deinococcus pimensis]